MCNSGSQRKQVSSANLRGFIKDPDRHGLYDRARNCFISHISHKEDLLRASIHYAVAFEVFPGSGRAERTMVEGGEGVRRAGGLEKGREGVQNGYFIAKIVPRRFIYGQARNSLLLGS